MELWPGKGKSSTLLFRALLLLGLKPRSVFRSTGWSAFRRFGFGPSARRLRLRDSALCGILPLSFDLERTRLSCGFLHKVHCSSEVDVILTGTGRALARSPTQSQIGSVCQFRHGRMVQEPERRSIRPPCEPRAGFRKTGSTCDGHASCESSGLDGVGHAHPYQYQCGSPPIAGWLSGELPGRPSRSEKAPRSAIPTERLRVRDALRLGSRGPK